MARESLGEAEIPPEILRLTRAASREVDGRTEEIIRKYNLVSSLDLTPTEARILSPALARRVARDHFMRLADARGLKLAGKIAPGRVPSAIKTEEERRAEGLLVKK